MPLSFLIFLHVFSNFREWSIDTKDPILGPRLGFEHRQRLDNVGHVVDGRVHREGFVAAGYGQDLLHASPRTSFETKKRGLVKGK